MEQNDPKKNVYDKLEEAQDAILSAIASETLSSEEENEINDIRSHISTLLNMKSVSVKYAIFEYVGDYAIDHQPNWYVKFDSMLEAVNKAILLYAKRVEGKWEPEMEAAPGYVFDDYHIVVQESTPGDEDAFEKVVWAIGVIPELVKSNNGGVE